MTRMVIYLAPLVMLIGLILFCVSTNGKVVEIGKWMFICGMLAFLLATTGKVYRLP